MRKWSCPLLNKKQLRTILRAKRQSISVSQQQSSMIAVATLFTAHPLFQRSQHIACYLPNDNELDCSAIIEAIWKADKNCYLPVLSPQGKNLEFLEYRSFDSLCANKYGILEPDNTAKIAVEKLDLVLVPLVGFDLAGHRLGMGGGYYDRTFEFLLTQEKKTPCLIGLGFEEQQMDALPFDEWDVMLDGVLTEKRWLNFFTY
jgi:5-formyltetrahydrofolate cyclo-ligase